MKRLSHLLGELTATVGQPSIQAMLDGAARGSVGLLPIEGAGVVLLPSAATPEYLGASDSASLEFQRLQGSLMQGPCFAAHNAVTAYCVPDLARSEGFPEFTTAARQLGLAGVFAFPLRRDGISLGALALYRMSPGALGTEEMRAAQDLADFLAAYVSRVRRETLVQAVAIQASDEVSLLQALQDERTFVATVIHELSSSVASIDGFTWLLENTTGSLSERQHHFVDAIRRNGNDLRTLIVDLLTLLSLEPGAVPASRTRERVDLRTVVETIRDTLAIVPATTRELLFRVPVCPIAVEGDPKQLERMLANVLSNALKYTPPSGTVACVLSREGSDAILEVRDTGIGVRVEEQGEVFERFFRASNAKEYGVQGTGLGLAIVKAVAESHGGTVSLSSTLGAGTRVRISLPVADDDGPMT